MPLIFAVLFLALQKIEKAVMYLRGCSPSGAFSYGYRLARKVTENLVSRHRADTREKEGNVTATRLLFSLHIHNYIDN